MKKMMVVGFVCLSMTVVAQTNSNGAVAKNAKKSQAAASGQAGKQGKSADRESSAPSVSEITVKKTAATGRESSAPSVSEATVKPSNNGPAHVATGDLNGDGMPDLAAQNAPSGTKQNGSNTATGQVSGKRQHAPVQIKKEVDAASPKL